MTDAPQKKPPPRELVQALMQMYPRLDYLLAETCLSFSEEELERFLEKKSSVDVIEDVNASSES